ncbi:GC-rich sequence DNA-binding factor-like protein-domain-containing protein [Infundibulicybe gibba]|nr:GC-rich sequence DNA-binding factor-like protein-domain-containing protein [Infundibulicybe gibba]
MARRKRVLDDGDSDSSEGSEVDIDFETDPTLREERALFEDPYQRKRRRKNGKEDALYGVFGEDSEEDSRPAAGARRKVNYSKTPAFVSSETKVDLDKEMTAEDQEGVTEGGGDDSESSNSEDEDEYPNNPELSKPPSPRVREDEDEDRPSVTRGMGFGSAGGTSTMAAPLGGIGHSRGIGSRSTPSASAQQDLPSAFGMNKPSTFIRDTSTPKPAVPLSAADLAHFNKLQGSFGARMLANMGWRAGTGLGTTGEGIVTPMGIAFKGFKEKTEQSKMEARRKGEVVSDDEDVKAKKIRKKAKEQQEKRADIWKRPKKIKTKIEHKTYEEIIAEAGEEPSSGVGQIIDATGAVPREVSSLADISLNSWSPSNDPTRIPEVRHNIKLIADACKTDLDGLAREAKALEERKQWVTSEDARLRKKVEDEAELISRLQQLQLVTSDITAKSKELSSSYEVSLDLFSPLFYTLVDQFSREFEKYRLDEVVVAAIAPLIRRMVADWDPLQDPTAFISTLKGWRRALRITENIKQPQSEVDVYGSTTVPAAHPEVDKSMTPFESLLWNIWLPKVRASLNNEWSPETPQPVVRLYEVWSTFLPPFIRDNLLDQLILPKVQKAIAEWSPRTAFVSLRTIVFPWLPHVGLRLEDLVGDARRKVKNVLRSWTIGDDLPSDLMAWKEVFDVKDWDTMLLRYIVPKLGTILRNEFRINPRQQDMKPLEQVLVWNDIIRPSIFSQILETEFFPQWLDVLHIWLIQPQVNFEEVAQWYSFWKSTFPESVQALPGVSRGFTRGLQLMNQAIELGPDAPTQLPRPDFRAEQLAATNPAHTDARSAPPRPQHDFAASHNLLFVPTGKAHERSRMPLFKVSPTADGKGGLLVYILDDAEYRAVTLEDMVVRANS